jgi:hypothetical protein
VAVDDDRALADAIETLAASAELSRAMVRHAVRGFVKQNQAG